MALSSFDRKFIFLTSLGGVLEFFDFIIFIYLADILSSLFFPKNSAFLSLVLTFSIFAISYFIRPLGGIIFGHLGDRVGRKYTFILTISVMALPTLAISFLPTAAQIGVLAPILLLICRIVQGLAIGGEIPGAITFLAENVNPHHRNFACATIFFGFNIGMLGGEGITSILQSSLNHQEFLRYGWRIPFFIGGVFGFISLCLRHYLKGFSQTITLSPKSEIPIKTISVEYRSKVVQGAGIVAVNAVFIYLIYILMPAYLRNIYPNRQALISLLCITNLVAYSGMLLVMGVISDRLQGKKIFQFGCGGLILFSYLFYYFLNQGNFTIALLLSCFFSIFTAAISSSFPLMICELFPQSIRYTGVGLSYNLAFALLGGTTPLVSTFLIKLTNNTLAPAFYLMLISSIGLIMSLRFKNNSLTSFSVTS